jgi:hypothetical protein
MSLNHNKRSCRTADNRYNALECKGFTPRKMSVSPDDLAPSLTLGGLARLLELEASAGPIPLYPVGV